MKNLYVVKATLAEGGTPEFAPVESAEKGITCRGYCLMTLDENGKKSIIIDGMSTMDLAAFFNTSDALVLCQAAEIGKGMQRAVELELESKGAKTRQLRHVVEMDRDKFISMLRGIGAEDEDDAED